MQPEVPGGRGLARAAGKLGELVGTAVRFPSGEDLADSVGETSFPLPVAAAEPTRAVEVFQRIHQSFGSGDV